LEIAKKTFCGTVRPVYPVSQHGTSHRRFTA